MIKLNMLFCTVVSKYRLHQCIAMYNSLRDRMAEAYLAVLAVDVESGKVLDALKLPGMLVMSDEELENDELKELKRKRSPSEYCWTLKPLLLLNLYERFREVKIFVYVDTDIFFFDNPMKLFRGKERWHVLLTTHKVNRMTNGGFAAFRRGNNSYMALKWWKDRCIEWCCCKYDNGRFADQGYLDSMSEKFNGVKYINIPGVNVASWNYFQYDFSIIDGNIHVNGIRLIFYHFSGLRLKRYAGTVSLWGAEIPCVVCGIYSKALRDAIMEIEGIDRKVTDYFYLEDSVKLI